MSKPETVLKKMCVGREIVNTVEFWLYPLQVLTWNIILSYASHKAAFLLEKP